ncbi:hypothetical protein GcC1_069026 [Golovinomyces cichoracearum]|uniref:Uncharacterized protein n=1 Tax=Golovinomyces cichoracearum TaxID=62708 RepID=A0A420IQA7_9PEZI|nr:hypothetical protein GcC1_069026 [Golovinomyces cichoracearum]
MEEYLNKIRQLNDDLFAKNINLPKQIIIDWVLNNLTDDFEIIVSSITQSLRTDVSYNIEQLFANFLDESKRLSSSAKKNHNTSECFFLKRRKQNQIQSEAKSQAQCDESSLIDQEDNLLVSMENEENNLIDFNNLDFDPDLEQNQVLITIPHDKKNIEKVTDTVTNYAFPMLLDRQLSSKFILDTATKKHIISNKNMLSTLEK